MRHIFVVNPAAGKKDRTEQLTKEIERVTKQENIKATIHVTTGVGDAKAFAAECGRKSAGEEIFIYACGGDGTLGQVVSGAAHYPNMRVGVIPIGTGNDFIRNFTNTDQFMNLTSQLYATPTPMDLLHWNDDYCVNMINTGFDCEVVAKVAEIKRKPWVPSRLAYIIGLIMILSKMPGVSLKLSMSNEPAEEKELLLCTIANGQYCGGGFRSNPKASICDGLLDVCAIQYIKRGKFLSLVGKYKKGTHLEAKGASDIIGYRQGKRIDLFFEKEQNICVDGDIAVVKELHVEAVPKGFQFLLPQGCSLIQR